jgi:CRISPR system Cascade subunit CasA
MTLWRIRTDKDTQAWLPQKHDPSKQLWRNFVSIAGQKEDGHCPGTVRWISILRSHDVLPFSVVQFQGACVLYNTNGIPNQKTVDIFADTIGFNADLLTALGSAWVDAIVEELDETDRLIVECGILAKGLAQAEGNTDKKGLDAARDKAKAQAYSRMDLPFRKWLEGINPQKDRIPDQKKAWWTTAQGIVRGLAREWMENCSPQAFMGHNEISAAQAYQWFLIHTKDAESLKKAREGKANARGKKQN